MSIGRRVLERVVKQDQQELLESILVSFDPGRLKRVEGKRLTLGEEACFTVCFQDNCIEVNRTALERNACVSPRQLR